MARGFKPARFGPHDFNKGRNWFYVNQGSVDVCDGRVIMRLPRKALHEMIASLKPLAVEGLRLSGGSVSKAKRASRHRAKR